MSIPMWFIPVFILLAILSFVMTPPTFLVNKVTSRFKLHPTLGVDDAIRIDDHELTGPEQRQFIQAWDEANYLYQHHHHLRTQDGVILTVSRPDRTVQFMLKEGDEDNVDVIRLEQRKRQRAYRLQSTDLQNWLHARLKATDGPPQRISKSG